MTPELLPEDHHEEVTEFLSSVFPSSGNAQFLDRKLRHWKYYAAHPYAKGSRCYVFRDAEGLFAHGGVSPLEYCTAGAIQTSFQVIDWAGAPRRAGSGFMLFRALWPTADTYLGIGGSDDAQKVMRRIPTLRIVGNMEYFAYPLRPWGQLTTSPWGWRSPLKWGRSWKWRLARQRPSLAAWRAIPVDRVHEDEASLLVPVSERLYTPLRRTPELVNYWLDCPAGRMQAWRLEHAGSAVGYLVLAFLRKVARIADLIVNTPSAPLAEAFSLAMDLAAKDGTACELNAASTAPPAIQAMAEAGMIRRDLYGVFLGDPGGSLPANLPLEANLTIGDGFYQQGEQPYFHSF